MSRGVQIRTNGRNPPIHHVARRNHIRTRCSQRNRRLRQQLHAGVVLNLIAGIHPFAIASHNPAMPMRHVLAQTNIRNHHQVPQPTLQLQRPQPRLHDPVIRPRPATLLILRRRQPKQQ